MNYKINNISAVIPIGGKGTRLKSITSEVPKPLYPINGKSTLYRCCEQLKSNGIEDIYITINYNSDSCTTEIRKIEKELSISIQIFKEEEELGECGALWKIKNRVNKKIIFINGDLIYSIAINKLFEFHTRLGSEFTLVTHVSSHPSDSDLVSASNGSQIDSIYLKSDPSHQAVNAYLGNAGIAVFDKVLLYRIDSPKGKEPSSLFHHLVYNAFKLNIRIFSYNTTEYIKDMGTPDRFIEIENLLKKNLIEINNYNRRQKVLFLDRDNTIIECEDKNYIINSKNLKFLDANIHKIINLSKGYNFVCLVTNQPQIAMGLISIKYLEEIHSKIVKYCLNLGLKIDVISFCPHHPHQGYESEINVLKNDCFCRKPQPGMLIKQSYDRNIDLEKSLLIGDSECDRLAAENANCQFLDVKYL